MVDMKEQVVSKHREGAKSPDMQARTRPSFCDLVLKGGITSGVVYPGAICELAESFRFKNVGGTSAGAIAAAATAAAEYGRQTGSGRGFEELEQLPNWLSEGKHLQDFFQPHPMHARLFACLQPWLGGDGSFAWKVCRSYTSMWRMAPLSILIPLVLFLFGTMVPFVSGNAQSWIEVGIAGLSCFSLSMCLGIWGMIRRASRLRHTGYGLCSGLATGNAAESPPALTDWLCDSLDRWAGKHSGEQPLTFGDLACVEFGEVNAPSTEKKGIRLRMTTACLNLGRPYHLPLDTGRFFFHPGEFSELFPGRIVNHLVAHGRKPRNARERALWNRLLPLRPLPEPADMPVVVATRMSLSFPLLLSAVPLYAVDWSLRANQVARSRGEGPKAERCWFADGGICSNFPLHLFDDPLPRWPGFAINLRDYHPDYQPAASAGGCETRREREEDSWAHTWLARSHRSGWMDGWVRWDTGNGWRALCGYLKAIVSTMQNWSDCVQERIPGNRDRVVHIHQNSLEGGLNLQMPPARIRSMCNRGHVAGRLLRERFQADPKGECEAWDQHRWIRYRSTMAVLERHLLEMKKGYDAWEQEGWWKRMMDNPPAVYPWLRKAQREFALKATGDLMGLLDEWERSGQSFAEGAPRPLAELKRREIL